MRMWMLMALISAVCYGTNNIFLKLASGKVSDTLSALCIQALSLAVICTYFAYTRWIQGEGISWTRAGVLFAAGSGFMMGLGLIFLLAVFRMGGPISLAIPVLLSGQVVIAVVVGILFFKEGFSLTRVLGLAFCFLGIWLASSR